MSTPFKYDASRVMYVGLNKIRDRLVAGTHKVPDISREITGTMKAGAKLSPVAANTSISADASLSESHRTVPLSDIPDEPELRAVAPVVLEEVMAASEPISSTSPFEPGRIYTYRGQARFCVRTHDDFRQEGDQEIAPRLGLWLIEVPDSPTDGQDESVSWVILSGTAQGQITTELGGTIGDWRGGSQTEHLFELLAATSRGEERTSHDTRWLEDPWFAMAAAGLVRESYVMTVEVAFLCFGAKDCSIVGEERTVSYQGWSPASTGKEAPVRRVAMGTPFFVQFTKPDHGGLMRLIRGWLGFA